MANSVLINVGANATGVYSEIIRQAKRAEEVIKRTPIRLQTKNFGAIKGFTADIDRFDKSLTRMSAVIQTFGQSAAILFGVQRAMLGLVRATIDVEKRMLGLQAVMGGTTDSFKKFGDGLFEVAKQTGQSFATVTDAAQEFARQGLGVEETLKRTRDALILTRTTGLDVASAVSDLTATLNTFKKEALDSTKVINTFRNVDTAFAVSAADLAEGIKRSGAAAQDAKVSFNELNALITSLQQNTARGGSVIGNSLKSIFTRVQRNDTLEALEGIGVATRDMVGNLRPTVQILTELATKIQFLSDTQKAQVKETVAGTYQINALSALLQDLSSKYSVYNQALSTASNSTNEAIKSNEKLNQSTSAIINETLVNLTQFASKIGEVSIAPFIKNTLNSINGLFDNINNLGEDSIGAKLGKGLLQGLANFISGPGITLLGAALFKISRLVFEGAGAQLKSVLTLSKENENILENQRRVESVLRSQDPAIQKLIVGARTRLEFEQRILSVIQAQNSNLSLEQGLIRSTATSLTRRGGKTAASGYIPDMASEKMQVNRGVGGAPRSARPVVIPNFNFGGGKRDTIVANSSEYVVPNFAGSDGSAIFNQDMIKHYGLPKGAKKITAAGGFLPKLFNKTPFKNFPLDMGSEQVEQIYKQYANAYLGFGKGNGTGGKMPQGLNMFANRMMNEMVYHQTGESYVLGSKINDIFLPRYFAPKSLKEGYKSIKELGSFDNVAALVTNNLTPQLEKAGFSTLKSGVEVPFRDEKVMKDLLVSSKFKTPLLAAKLLPSLASGNFKDLLSGENAGRLDGQKRSIYYGERGRGYNVPSLMKEYGFLAGGYIPNFASLGNFKKSDLPPELLDTNINNGYKLRDYLSSYSTLGSGAIRNVFDGAASIVAGTGGEKKYVNKSIVENVQRIYNDLAPHFDELKNTPFSLSDKHPVLGSVKSYFKKNKVNLNKQTPTLREQFAGLGSEYPNLKSYTKGFLKDWGYEGLKAKVNSGQGLRGTFLEYVASATEKSGNLKDFLQIPSGYRSLYNSPNMSAALNKRAERRDNKILDEQRDGNSVRQLTLKQYNKALDYVRYNNSKTGSYAKYRDILNAKEKREGLRFTIDQIKQYGPSNDVTSAFRYGPNYGKPFSDVRTYAKLGVDIYPHQFPGQEEHPYFKERERRAQRGNLEKTYDTFRNKRNKTDLLRGVVEKQREDAKVNLFSFIKKNRSKGTPIDSISNFTGSTPAAATKTIQQYLYGQDLSKIGFLSRTLEGNIKDYPYLFRGGSVEEFKILNKLGAFTSGGYNNSDSRMGTNVTSSFAKSLGYAVSSGRDKLNNTPGLVGIFEREGLLKSNPYSQISTYDNEANNTLKVGKLDKGSLMGFFNPLTGKFASKNSELVRGAPNPEFLKLTEGLLNKSNLLSLPPDYSNPDLLVSLFRKLNQSGVDKIADYRTLKNKDADRSYNFEGIKTAEDFANYVKSSSSSTRAGATPFGLSNSSYHELNNIIPVAPFQRKILEQSAPGNFAGLNELYYETHIKNKDIFRQKDIGELFTSSRETVDKTLKKGFFADFANILGNNYGYGEEKEVAHITSGTRVPLGSLKGYTTYGGGPLAELLNPALAYKSGRRAANGYVPNMAKYVVNNAKQKSFVDSLRPLHDNISAALNLSGLVGGKVNTISLKGSGPRGVFDPNSNNINLNSAFKGGALGANTLIHEIGHAAFKGLKDSGGGGVLNNLRRAYDASREGALSKGRGLGTDLSGYPKSQYFEENVAQAFAENLAPFRANGSDLKKNTLYRYVRKLATKGLAADGYIPNFGAGLLSVQTGSLGKRLGRGAFGAFYGLKGGVGVKRMRFTEESDVKNEYAMSKLLHENPVLPGVVAPKVIGTLKRSLEALRVGKEVISDPVFGKSNLGLSAMAPVAHSAIRENITKSLVGSHGIFANDLNSSNYTINEAGQNFFKKKKIENILYRTIATDIPIDKIKKFARIFEKAGGRINIIDPGNFEPVRAKGRALVDKYTSPTSASGYVPNFAHPLVDSVSREVGALTKLGFDKSAAKASVRVGKNPRLAASGNPAGLGVYNTLQGQSSLGRALLDHNGENLKNAGIPNFAPNLPSANVDAKFYGMQTLSTFGGRAINNLKDIKFAGLDSLTTYIKNLSSSVAEIDRNRSKFSNAGQLIKEYNKRIALGVQEINRRSFAGNPFATEVKGGLQQSYQTALDIQRRPGYEENIARLRKEQAAMDKISADRVKRQDTLFKSSFALPFIGAGLASATDNERQKATINNLSSDLSLATTLPLLTGGGPVGIGAGVAYGGFKTIRAAQDNYFENKFKTGEKGAALEESKGRVAFDVENFQKFQQTFSSLADAKDSGDLRIISDLGKNLASVSDNFLDSKFSDAARKALSSNKKPEEIQVDLGKFLQETQDTTSRENARKKADLDVINNADPRRSFGNQRPGLGFKNLDEVKDLASTIASSVDVTKLTKQQKKSLTENIKNPFSTVKTLSDVGLDPLAAQIDKLGGVSGKWNEILSTEVALKIQGIIKNKEFANSFDLILGAEKKAGDSAKSLSNAFLRFNSIKNNRENARFDRVSSVAQERLRDETSPTYQILGEKALEEGQISNDTKNQVFDVISSANKDLLEKLASQVGDKKGGATAQSYVTDQLKSGNIQTLIDTFKSLGTEADNESANEIVDKLQDILVANKEQIQKLNELTKIRLERNSLESGKNLFGNLGDKAKRAQFNKALGDSLNAPQKAEIKKGKNAEKITGFENITNRLPERYLEIKTDKPKLIDGKPVIDPKTGKPQTFTQTKIVPFSPKLNPFNGTPGGLSGIFSAALIGASKTRNPEDEFPRDFIPGEEKAYLENKQQKFARANADINLFKARKDLGIVDNLDARRAVIAEESDPEKKKALLAKLDADKKRQRDLLTPAYKIKAQNDLEQQGIEITDTFSQSIGKVASTGLAYNPLDKIKKDISVGNYKDVDKRIEEARGAITRGSSGTQQEANLQALDEFIKNLKETSLDFLQGDQKDLTAIAASRAAQDVGGLENPQITELQKIVASNTDQTKALGDIVKISGSTGESISNILKILQNKIQEATTSQQLNSDVVNSSQNIRTEEERLSKLEEIRTKVARQNPINNNIAGDVETYFNDAKTTRNPFRGTESSAALTSTQGVLGRDQNGEEILGHDVLPEFLNTFKNNPQISGKTLLENDRYSGIKKQIGTYRPDLLKQIGEKPALINVGDNQIEQTRNDIYKAKIGAVPSVVRADYYDQSRSNSIGAEKITTGEKQTLLDRVSKQAGNLAGAPGALAIDPASIKAIEDAIQNRNNLVENKIDLKINVATDKEVKGADEGLQQMIITSVQKAIQDYHQKNNPKSPIVQ